MTKVIFKENIQTAINSLVAFDAKDRSFQGTQAEYAKAHIREWRTACQAIVKKTAHLPAKQRDAALVKMGLNILAGRSNKDVRIAWYYLGGKNGLQVVKLIEADKLGASTTIRGIISKARKEIEPKQTRAAKSGQGKTKKQVSFTAGKNAKITKVTTKEQKLALLEEVAQAHGFNLIDFFNEWSEEAAEPAQKLVANG